MSLIGTVKPVTLPAGYRRFQRLGGGLNLRACYIQGRVIAKNLFNLFKNYVKLG